MEIKSEVTIHDLRRRTLFIATPMYDGMCTQTYFQSCVMLSQQLTKLGITHVFHNMGNESLIQRARNYCVEEFMLSGFTHLLFIDADISFDLTAILDMLALASPQSQFDILCGPYPKKDLSPEKVVAAVRKNMIKKPSDVYDYIGDFVFNLPPGEHTINFGQPFEVNEAGTGFMMIQRHVFEQMAERYGPWLMYKPDHKRDKKFDGTKKIGLYFECEVDRGTFTPDLWAVINEVANGNPDAQKMAEAILSRASNSTERYLSEDYLFCRMARAAGVKVWMLPWVRLQHTGRFMFGGSLPKILKAGIAATYEEEKQDERPEPTVSVPF